MEAAPRASARHTARSTKIVCTIGPATSDAEGVSSLVVAGMDVARLNLSHGSHEEHAAAYHCVRAASDQAGRAVGVLADLQGPKLRLERLAGGTASLDEGATLVIGTAGSTGTAREVSTSYADLAEDLHPGDTVLLNDGTIELVVVASGGGQVECQVVRGGTIRDHSGINLPGVRVSAPTLTDKDLVDLRFALELGVDMVALSFVRGPEDADALRSVMHEFGTRVPVIAKVERPEAVERLEDIVDAFDGIMLARGDLGVETPSSASRSSRSGPSRWLGPRPSRSSSPRRCSSRWSSAAVPPGPRPRTWPMPSWTGRMLSCSRRRQASAVIRLPPWPPWPGSSAQRESWADPGPPPGEARGWMPRREAIALGAVSVGTAVGAKALVAFTRTGDSARLLAAQRPSLPVLAFTPTPRVRSQLALVWGVETFLEPAPAETDQMVAQVDRAMLELGRAVPGDLVVVVAGTPPGVEGTTNMLRVHRLGVE